MIQTEARTLGYAIAGSLAVHLALAVAFALWIGLVSLDRIHFTPRVVDEQPEVTLVFPEPPPPPAPPKKEERYIRTTQNDAAQQAPANPDFVSDRNTVAAAKDPASANGDKAMPSMKGLDFPTNELADRSFKDGETKNDSAPSASATTAVVTAATAPAPAPSPKAAEIAKKDDARAETMMKELDSTLAKQEPPPPDAKKPEETRDALPAMRPPEEKMEPHAIPVASQIVNTPQQEKNALQPETHRSATKGAISTPGPIDAVSAAATPTGRYMRQVTSAVEKRWNQLRRERPDVLDPGKMGLRFYVNKNGKPEQIEFVFSEANPLMQNLVIDAIFKADIPPIPRELLPILERERLEINYDIVIYPGR